MPTPIQTRVRKLAPPLLTLAVLYALFLGWVQMTPQLSELGGNQLSAGGAKAVMSALWLTGAWLLSRVLNTFVLDGMMASRTGRETPGIITNSLSIVLFLLAILIIVGLVFEQPVGAVVATSGVITLVIGFALRELIAAFFSGLAINLETPYQLGDWVELEPALVGRVVAINWRATRLLTQDERTIVIPNNVLAGRMLVNYSLPTPVYRESMELALNHNIEPKRINNILMAAIEATPAVVAGHPHRVRIDRFTDRGVLVELTFWIGSYADRIPARHAVAVNVLDFLSQAGVDIPYAQHDVFFSRQRPRERERRLDLRGLLARIELFEELTPQELQQLASTVIGIDFEAGTRLINEGDEDSTLFLVVEGLLAVTVVAEAGAEKQVGRILPGQTVGEMSLLTGSRRTATVTAQTKAYVLVVAREDIEPILRARPEVADALSRSMAVRQLATQQSLAKGEQSKAAAVLSRTQQIRAKIQAFFGLA